MFVLVTDMHCLYKYLAFGEFHTEVTAVIYLMDCLPPRSVSFFAKGTVVVSVFVLFSGASTFKEAEL